MMIINLIEDYFLLAKKSLYLNPSIYVIGRCDIIDHQFMEARIQGVELKGELRTKAIGRTIFSSVLSARQGMKRKQIIDRFLFRRHEYAIYQVHETEAWKPHPYIDLTVKTLYTLVRKVPNEET